MSIGHKETLEKLKEQWKFKKRWILFEYFGAKTPEEIIRLAPLAKKLGWQLEKLPLTEENGSPPLEIFLPVLEETPLKMLLAFYEEKVKRIPYNCMAPALGMKMFLEEINRLATGLGLDVNANASVSEVLTVAEMKLS